MQSHLYDVTLYWHDRGAVFLGTVRAMSNDDAGQVALNHYISLSKANAKEIEEGGGFQTYAELLMPDEAAQVLSK